MERIIGVNSNCYHGYGVEDALRGIRAAGFRYVELTATKNWTEHVFPTQSFEKLCGVRALLEELGLDAFALSGHTNLMDQTRLPDFILNMQLAHFFGSRYIVSSIGEAHMEDKATTGNAALARNIQSLLPHLEKYGLTLALELHGDHATGGVMDEIVTLVGSGLVTVNYDTANAIFYGNVQPEQDIDTCMDHLGYMHLKEKAGDRKEWNFPALGKGYVDFKTIFDKLEKQGNPCPFSIEIEFTQQGPSGLDEINQAVQDSAAYLRAQGFRF